MSTVSRHRFRPRYRGVAWTAVGVGGSLAAFGALASLALLPIATGAVGIAAGIAYLASPTWRLEVVVDDRALRVERGGAVRFELPWAEVVKVIAAPANHTCFVDGGTPERSLLVPGVGAPAPYDLDDRAGLYEAIVARVPAAKVELRDTLEPPPPPPKPPRA